MRFVPGRLTAALGIVLALGQLPARAQTGESGPAPGIQVSPAPAVFPESGGWGAPAPGPGPLPWPGARLEPPLDYILDNQNRPVVPDAFLDRAFHPPPGWFTDAEVGMAWLHLLNQATGQVMLAGTPTTVQLPTASLGLTAIPRIGIGYRFQEMGELTLSYQGMFGQGREVLPNFDALGAGSLRSRLNMSVVDFDWAGSENSLGPLWDMKWRFGVRYANIFFDSQAQGAQILDERTSNIFNGAGVRAGLDLHRALPVPGLSLFGKIEGSFLVGPVSQSFEETVRESNGTIVSGVGNSTHHVNQDAFTNTATPLILILEGGFSYVPSDWGHWLRLSAVYHFEQWWAMGIPLTGDGLLTVNGIFFKAELNF
jgi:hypothetical protein